MSYSAEWEKEKERTASLSVSKSEETNHIRLSERT